MKTIKFMNNFFRCGRSRWGIRFCFWWWRLGRRRKYRRNYDANCKCWKYIIFGSQQKAEYINLISNFCLKGATLWAISNISLNFLAVPCLIPFFLWLAAEKKESKMVQLENFSALLISIQVNDLLASLHATHCGRNALA